MAKLSKRVKANVTKYDLTKPMALEAAFDAVKACATAKFDESVDVAIQLGIDVRKSDQAIRGAVVMPEGTGKNSRCFHTGRQGRRGQGGRSRYRRV